MKTYTVLYAEDVPHYGSTVIEAPDDEAALALAKAIDHDELAGLTVDPNHDDTVCKRIIHIEREDGSEIARDIPLDRFHLRNGGDADRLLCDHASDMLGALESAHDIDWVANAAITTDIEALRRICLDHAAWWNNIALPLITKIRRPS